MTDFTEESLKLKPKIINFEKIKNISISHQEGFVLSLIDGKTSLSDLLKLSVISKKETLTLIEKLYKNNIVQFNEKNIPILQNNSNNTTNKPNDDDKENNNSNKLEEEIDKMFKFIQNRNYYEILNLSRNFSDKILKNNYRKLSKKFHPDRYFGQINEETKDKLDHIFASLSEAYMTLNNKDKRDAYDSLLIKGNNEGNNSSSKPYSKNSVKEKGKNFIYLGDKELVIFNYKSALNNYKLALSYLPENNSLKDKISKTEWLIALQTKVEKINKDNMLLELDTIKELLNEMKIKLKALPNDEKLIFEITKILTTKTKNTDIPEKLVDKLIQISPNNVNYHILSSEIKEKVGKIDDALEVIEKILKIDKRNIKAKEQYKKLKKKLKTGFFGGRL